jgi:hypothetical protein
MHFSELFEPVNDRAGMELCINIDAVIRNPPHPNRRINNTNPNDRNNVKDRRNPTSTTTSRQQQHTTSHS